MSIGVRTTKRPHAARFAALAVVVAIAGSAVFAARPTRAAASTRGPVQRVLIISLPALRWADLDLRSLPNLRGLLDQSAVASFSLRGINRQPSLGDSYVTISAGARARARGDYGNCLAPSEPFEAGTAAQEYARRTGIGVPPGTVAACLAMPKIVLDNHGLLYGARPGLFAATLRDAGVARAVIANADDEGAGSEVANTAAPTTPPATTSLRGTSLDTVGHDRSAALVLAPATGFVGHGTLDAGLVTRDVHGPFGLGIDVAAYERAFERAWQPGRRVVLVEDSDLVRYASYRSRSLSHQQAVMRDHVLQRFDTVLGSMLARVDPTRDAVMVIAPIQPTGPTQITLAALRAPGLAPTYLRSPFTRRTGVVSIVDVSPTVLALLGIDRPSAMEGRPWEAAGSRSSLASAMSRFIDENAGAVFRDGLIGSVTLWYVIAQVVLVALAIAALQWHRPASSVIDAAALGLLLFPLVTFLAGVLPFRSWGTAAYWLATIGVAALAGTLLRRLTGPGVQPLLIALSAIVLFFAVDLVVGGPLEYNTVFGYTPTVAGRFAGIGNLAYSYLAAAAVLLAGLVAYRVRGRRGVRLALAVLAGVIVLDGAPFLGSDVGGVLSMVPAYALAVVMLAGWRVRRRLVVWGVLGTAAAITLAGAVDMSRPPDRRTHLGRLIESVHRQGFGALWLTLHRKLNENLGVLFSSIWTFMTPVVLAGIAYLVYRAPGRLRGLHDRMPPMRAALAGLGVVALLGFALNDSGIAIPGVMLGTFTPVAVVLVARIERDAIGASSP